MDEEQKLFLRRIQELTDTSYTQGRYVFSDFLTGAELSDVLSMGSFACGLSQDGGHEGAERVMLRFGSEEQLGYEEPFPITILKIAPVQEKFADTLSHRDFLGAILNLGIDRKVTGDILTDGTEGYLICEEKIADFIIENLTKIKHTNVKISQVEAVPESLEPKTVAKEIQIESERLDAVIAHVFNLSRTEASEAFRQGLVHVGGKAVEQKTVTPKAGDIVSVRGHGRFRYVGVSRTTRKGKLSVTVEVYV